MTKFNVGKFNVKNSEIASVNGNSDLVLESNISKFLVDKYISEAEASIELDAKANFYIKIMGVKSNADMEINSRALSTNLMYASEATGDMSIDAFGVGSLLGEDYVEIKGLVLKPGQEVEIDMCNLTVTVNGENAMHLMSTDGDFFDFLIGDNDIEIEAIGANGVQIDTYWKDKWL
ncbi:phage distal tail protein [Peptoniphilus vaginalis]|uniref:phage distal tail protein n=1 Tax=Peptoniphilus vaginalis TaxID=1756987 RepID=UPI0023F67473|nr:phage tail domain-containing protein [Peptoniphilus vaginalis]